MTATTTWRVVLKNGAIGCLGVGDAGGGWRDVGGRQYHPATPTWRVVLENGAIGCLGVGDAGGGWRDVGGRQYHPATPLRAAIAHAAWERDWPVVEIVAPGAPTADERVAALTAERDAARRAATLAETERDTLRAENERLKATGGEGR